MRVGAIGWVDLTVEDAGQTREFYEAVVGWGSAPVDMVGYEDFSMIPPEGQEPVAGICWARGPNAGLPAAWMIYIIVADLDRSLERCREMGGEILREPRRMGSARYCVIRDPAGAVCSLYQPASS